MVVDWGCVAQAGYERLIGGWAAVLGFSCCAAGMLVVESTPLRYIIQHGRTRKPSATLHMTAVLVTNHRALHSGHKSCVRQLLQCCCVCTKEAKCPLY